jgi:hypothetical protein
MGHQYYDTMQIDYLLAKGVEPHRHRFEATDSIVSLCHISSERITFFSFRISLFPQGFLTNPETVDNNTPSMSTMNRISICATGFLAVIQPLHAYVVVQPDVRPFIPNRGLRDTTNLGTLVVPSIGIGTISWSSKKGKSSIHLVRPSREDLASHFGIFSIRTHSFLNRQRRPTRACNGGIRIKCGIFGHR